MVASSTLSGVKQHALLISGSTGKGATHSLPRSSTEKAPTGVTGPANRELNLFTAPWRTPGWTLHLGSYQPELFSHHWLVPKAHLSSWLPGPGRRSFTGASRQRTAEEAQHRHGRDSVLSHALAGSTRSSPHEGRAEPGGGLCWLPP